MEVTGKIIAALPERGGTSSRTGNTWKSQEFVIETQDQYPKKCVFTVFGEDRLSQMNINVGDMMTVSFDIDAHEYNGRWFNDIRAWKVDRNVQAAAPAAVPSSPGTTEIGVAPAGPVMTPNANDAAAADDLPF